MRAHRVEGVGHFGSLVQQERRSNRGRRTRKHVVRRAKSGLEEGKPNQVQPRRSLSLGDPEGQGLKDSLLLLFLADGAVAGPRDRLQAFLLEFGFAVGADSVGALFNTIQGVVDSLQGAAVGIGLAEQKLLGIGVGGLIGQIDGRIVVSRAALFFGAGNAFQKLFPPGLQFLFVIVETLFVHSCGPTPAF